MFEKLKHAIKKRFSEKFSYFGGAKSDRTLHDWILSNVAIDRKLYSDLSRLRARARELVHENPYVSRYINVLRTNVIGSTGIKLQMRVQDPEGTPDDWANDRIEEAFDKWGMNCGTRGETWTEILNLAVTGFGIDGEPFGQLVDTEEGLKIHMIDAARVDVGLNRARTDRQNEIRMGIEVDSVGKMVAVWVKKENRSYQLPWESLSGKYVRIPGEDILHFFIPVEAGQTRGFPPLAPAMQKLHHLNGLDDATLITARAGAMSMGFMKSANGEKWAGKDDQKRPEIKVEPFAFQELPAGWEMQEWKPEIPETYMVFSKAIKQAIAVSLGTSYPTLSGDLEGTSFSSIRAGNATEQEYYKTLQKLICDKFATKIFSRWLKFALALGQINKLPFSKYDKFNKPSWICKRWAYVNPLDEAGADEKRLIMGTVSRTELVENQGGDLEDVFRQLAKEKKLAIKYGIDVAPEKKGNTNGPERKDDEENGNVRANVKE
jgi:lambda family phage portal protein